MDDGQRCGAVCGGQRQRVAESVGQWVAVRGLLRWAACSRLRAVSSGGGQWVDINQDITKSE